jgi:predicted dehydrogenase
MTDKLRVGIIGANPNLGWASRTHLPGLAAGIPGLELVAVSTTRQESADEAAKKFGVKHAFADHREMLEKADVDIVAVAVKLPHHLELTTDILNAGKHVYTEWPLGATTAEAEQITALAKQKGVRTAIGLQARRSAELAHARRLIGEGYVGDVLSVNMTQLTPGVLSRPAARTWMKDASQAANTLSIAFGHAIDGLMATVGPIESVAAVVSCQVGEWTASDTGETYAVDAPDNVLVSGRLKNGATLSVHVASVAGAGTGHRLEVEGTKGTLLVVASNSPHANAPTKLYGATIDAKGEATEFTEIDVPQEPWVGELGLTGGAINVGKLWKSFAGSFAGDGAFDPDFDSAVAHHRFIDAVQRASDTGQTQRV